MDRFGRARTLREEYESVLDAADEARQAYHREVIRLHRAGLTLREIADGLGLSHQRVHQIVGTEERQRVPRRTAVIATSLVLVVGAAVGGAALWSSGRPLPDTREPSRDEAMTEDRPRVIRCSTQITESLQHALDIGSSTCERALTSVAVMDPESGEILALMAPIAGSYP